MAKTTPRVKDIGQNLSAISDPVVVLSKIAAPFTTIVNRAKMVDLSNDLSVRMGIERIQVQSIMRIDGETGPAGEVVYKPVNDKYDQVRFVGSWTSPNNTAGAWCYSSTATTDFCEITFYGTALNILATDLDNTRDARATVDGGTEGANFIAASLSAVINLRNYATNIVVPVISGLTLGLHTVKIRNVNWLRLSGFEILNTASTLQIAAGTALVNGTAASLSAATTSAYNSGFESGTLGTRGGRVLVYMKNDGTIGKAVTPTDASSLTLTSTNHANEEVISSYFWREFGAGRSDDFSTLTTGGQARAFTLDDGTTTLVCGTQVLGTTIESLQFNQDAQTATLTFVGTGLDYIRVDGTSGGSDNYTVSIDGGSALTLSATGSTVARVEKIVSGLPYGTHTAKFTRVAASTYGLGIRSFIVYGPKKPTLPSGAMELADYNIMANYVANATVGATFIGTGLLRKASTREFVYSGTGWAVNAGIGTTGMAVDSSLNGDTVKYTFFGTGLEFRFYNNTGTFTVAVDGSTNLSAYTTSYYQSSVLTFIAATGIVSGDSGVRSSGIQISGIPLGVHTLTLTRTNAGILSLESIDIITPIHTHKNNGPFVLQNTLSVGSSGINDGRNLGPILEDSPTTAQVIGHLVNATTTSVTPVPIGDMHSAVYAPQDCMLEVHYNGTAYSTGAYYKLQVVVDGIGQQINSGYTTGSDSYVAQQLCIPIAKGWHFVCIHQGTSGGTAGTEVGASNYGRNLKIRLTPLNQVD